eukprot:365946-Chlamydomonas_euryale.AAC.4
MARILFCSEVWVGFGGCCGRHGRSRGCVENAGVWVGSGLGVRLELRVRLFESAAFARRGPRACRVRQATAARVYGPASRCDSYACFRNVRNAPKFEPPIHQTTPS